MEELEGTSMESGPDLRQVVKCKNCRKLITCPLASTYYVRCHAFVQDYPEEAL